MTQQDFQSDKKNQSDKKKKISQNLAALKKDLKEVND
jgi:hypothetical protein